MKIDKLNSKKNRKEKKEVKKLFVVSLSLLISIFIIPRPVLCQEEVVSEHKIKKGKVRGLGDRLDELERIVEGLQINGVIEVEAGYQKTDFKDPALNDEYYSDIVLATVELAVSKTITNRLKTHILLLHEEDTDDPIEVDEAIVYFQAEGVCNPNKSCNSPWFASVGRLYVPFGFFESHFITDSLTLDLGETRETAVVAGLWIPRVTLAVGTFNGDVDKADKNDSINSVVAAALFTMPEGTVRNFRLTAGASYLSNIADSNGLTDILDADFGVTEVSRYVPGASIFISAAFMEKLFLEAEWLGATKDFGDTPAVGRNFKPTTWNLELAYMMLEDLEIAARYAGSDNALNTLPEDQYAAIVTYGFWDSASVSLEYLHNKFENKDEESAATLQLAVVF